MMLAGRACGSPGESTNCEYIRHHYDMNNTHRFLLRLPIQRTATRHRAQCIASDDESRDARSLRLIVHAARFAYQVLREHLDLAVGRIRCSHLQTRNKRYPFVRFTIRQFTYPFRSEGCIRHCGYLLTVHVHGFVKSFQ